MHARNPYGDPPDFQQLAEAYPSLRKHIIVTVHGTTIDFTDEASQRRLTEAILHRDFGLELDLPLNRLCPPVPNRLNYILWLEDVMEACTLTSHPNNPVQIVRGLDVGTGASAIYPLLGCSTHPNWMFSATDIDDISTEYARKNVETNGLQDRVAVISADPSGPVLLPLTQSDLVYDFVMCNPPFYSSREDVMQSADAKELGPNAVCTGADVEMITPGGEAAFVGRMVEESLVLRDKCRWYTSMLGKLSSLNYIVQVLREHKLDNYAVSELVQGQTRRWVIGWSFGDTRLPDSMARLSYPGIQNLMPARNSSRQRLSESVHIQQLIPTLSAIIHSIDGVVANFATQEPHVLDIIVSTHGNTWSRAARRKRKDSTHIESGASGETRMATRIRYEDGKGEEASGSLAFDWVKGRDRSLFESFSSHVQRKVADAIGGRIH